MSDVGGIEIGGGILEYVVEKLRDLISIPTVNPPGRDYERCAKYLSNELEELGFDVNLIEIPEEYLDVYYPYRPQHRGFKRYIVLGRMGSGKPILHLNGHYDVVPEGSGWKHSPFNPILENGRLYGRGSTDMKGGIASMLGAFKVLAESSKFLRGTLEVSFVPDEESGGVGARYLAENGFVKPDYVVIGEGTTSKRIIIGHKGMVRGIVKVMGKQVHGSIPWFGDNAFLKASLLAQKFIQLYEPILYGRRTKYPTKRPEEVHPSINLGGYAESTSRKDNTVPGEFIFSFDRRVIPEEDIEHVVEELKEYFDIAAGDEVRYELEVLSAVEPSVTDPSSKIASIASEIGFEVSGVRPRLELSPGRNDAVFFTNIAGSEAINYGPGVEFTAHTPDEYTTLEELERFVQIYYGIIEKILVNPQ